ncbi:adenine deaminase [Methanothrix harundinacea]|uniref:Adenine deaminase n=1 Tax=Methanothrix harundinacea (strain 6Ac) TaxID=1110509 RepID=G7WNN1_METH6|nr:adenine deaminase [Methanothrix harundinacea]AET64007.1 Adenine deaminase [Methanothrix harundinacea 6Ac]
MNLEELIAAARGEVEVDLLLEGADLVNTLSGEVHRADVAIFRGMVVGFDPSSARETIDLSGRVLAPGFIDGHVHLESAMVTVPEYARAVVPRGTTAIVADPHEIANVLGAEGIRYIIASGRSSPLSVYVMLPSCVPATHLETSGSSLDAGALSELIDEEGVLGIGEVMNYPGVIFRDPSVLAKICLAGMRRKDGHRPRIDGHSPLLSGRDLAAYVAVGIGSDHECTSSEEAKEKLRLGMRIMIREGTAAKNLDDLLPLVTEANARRFLFVSDDRHPSDILRQGHIDSMVRRAVGAGLDPVVAISIGSLNAAEYFGLSDRGAVAPGRRADIVVLDDLDGLNVQKVLKGGAVVAEGGRMIVPLPRAPSLRSSSMKLAGLGPGSFDIKAEGDLVRAIGVIPDQIITRSLLARPKVEGGKVVCDLDSDLLEMAVVERHRGTGNVGLGLVSGFGLLRGAIATSVAHDSHNIAAVGVSSEEIFAAVSAVAKMGGGLVVVDGGIVAASLSLPIAGLLSDRSMEEVAEKIEEVTGAAKSLGSALDDPFMTLSFLCLPVIPELKLTDRGLVDVTRFDFVPLFVGDGEEA